MISLRAMRGSRLDNSQQRNIKDQCTIGRYTPFRHIAQSETKLIRNVYQPSVAHMHVLQCRCETINNKGISVGSCTNGC